MKSYDSHHWWFFTTMRGSRAENSPCFSSRNGDFMGFHGDGYHPLMEKSWKISLWIPSLFSSPLDTFKTGRFSWIFPAKKASIYWFFGDCLPVAKCLRLPEDHPSNWRITPFTRYTCPLLRYLSESYGKLIKIKKNVFIDYKKLMFYLLRQCDCP